MNAQLPLPFDEGPIGKACPQPPKADDSDTACICTIPYFEVSDE